MDQKIVDKFWKRVEKTDTCWNWTGEITYDGIGIMQKKRAHRLSWEIHNPNQPIPKGKIVRTSCHNPICVNPEHLYLSTPKEITRADKKPIDYSRLPEPVVAHFYSHIEKNPNGCWNWTGSFTKTEAPLMNRLGDKYMSRRVALSLSGKVMESDDQVIPICQNNACVNPDHLVCGEKERFFANVYKLEEKNGGCWVWNGLQNARMYGVFSATSNGKTTNILAHRYSWYLHTGFMPKALVVCHKCDHPYCVNPDHLFIGTKKDNSQDMVNKGRSARGERARTAKLTEQQVREIRELYDTKQYDTVQLSKIYGVARSVISRIVNRLIWKHVV